MAEALGDQAYATLAAAWVCPTTYFFIQATRLPRTTLETLAQSTRKRVSFTVFGDTNLLFSLLELHENPANEAATALEGLVEDRKGLVDFKLYVTNETLLEAKESLDRAAAGMERIVLTPRMISAASPMSLSGLRKRYVEQARYADGVRNSGEYFRYYTDNLLTLARTHHSRPRQTACRSGSGIRLACQPAALSCSAPIYRPTWRRRSVRTYASIHTRRSGSRARMSSGSLS